MATRRGVVIAPRWDFPARTPETDNIEALLNDRGKAAFETLGRQCIGEFTVQFAFQRMRDHVTVPELLDVPEIQYVKIPGEHITTAVTGVPGALAYVQNRLNGRPAPSSC